MLTCISEASWNQSALKSLIYMNTQNKQGDNSSCLFFSILVINLVIPFKLRINPFAILPYKFVWIT